MSEFVRGVRVGLFFLQVGRVEGRKGFQEIVMARSKTRTPVEIAVVGEVDDWEDDVVKALLEVPARGECAFYIDSSGGSVYGALAVVTLLRYRQLNATAIVLG